MRIFLTGGSGFVGSALIEYLSIHHTVHALVRSDIAAERVRWLGASPVSGCLDDVGLLDLRGFDAVVHADAPVLFWGPPEHFEAGIVQPATALYERALQCGVASFVHISSESVMQGAPSLLDIDESLPIDEDPPSRLGQAKLLAEQKLTKIQRASCKLIVFRPPFIWGAASPSLKKILLRARAGRFAWIDSGTSSFEAIHVMNLARAVGTAIETNPNAGIYLVTDGRARTVRSFFEPIFAANGIETPSSSIPLSFIRPLADLVEAGWQYLSIFNPPPLTVFEVDFFSKPRRYRIDKAVVELGYVPLAPGPELNNAIPAPAHEH